MEETKEKVTKVNLKPKEEPEVYKIDLSKPPPTNEVKENNTETPGDTTSNENSTTVQEQKEVQSQGEVQETERPVLEEITEVKEETKQEVKQEEKVVAEEKIVEEKTTELEKNIPESVQKLIDFMEETGGDLQDYVRLNTDVSKLDSSDALDEYYKATKPHLSAEERSFLLEETFGFDEEADEAKDIKKKKIALKEEIAKAKSYLESQKSKYYKEIKAGSRLTKEQQNAVDFFNRYNKDNAEQQKLTEESKKIFTEKTNNVFNQDFKGFDFKVGEKTFRYNVKNIDEVRSSQSDLNNFVNKFVNDKGVIENATGYHKSLSTAMNADALAQHFYEQGKADAIKDSVAKDKNINTEARQTHGEVQVGGLKYKVLGNSANDFKFGFKKLKK
jgi:hypothetical protein